MNKYFCFTIFHFSSTLLFDLMLEKELFAFTLFLMGISDSLLDQIGFQALCRNELWSKTVYHCICVCAIAITSCDCSSRIIIIEHLLKRISLTVHQSSCRRFALIDMIINRHVKFDMTKT